ncbi:MAG: hypothetical protein PWP37_1236 [Thermotogota bacterium]|nr:hypothetical protein [Thermotogota bacterium]MDK2865044.1 hypothetical protein [Thermotogota bacterium]HCZ06004.1 hypothetical protein [Thermotogota bacterium]
MSRKISKLLITMASLVLLVLAGCVSIPQVELISPNPAGGTVPIDTVLSWSLSKAFAAGEIRVYLSKWRTDVENKIVTPVILEVSRDSIRVGTDIPPLEWNSTYYWMVEAVEKDLKGAVLKEVKSSIGQFTTQPEPQIILSNPHTGDTVGGTVEVRWSVDGTLPESATKTFEILVGKSEDSLETLQIVEYTSDISRQEEVDLSEYDGENIYMAVRLKEFFPNGDILTQISEVVNVDVDTFGDVGLVPLYPEDGGMASEVDPELTWRINRKPANYTVRVYVDEDLSDLGPEAAWILESDGESAKLGDNEAPLRWNVFYYWKVALDRLDERGNVVKTYFGGPWSFYTPPEPFVDLVSPVGISVDATEIEFQWHLSRDIGDGWHELYLGENTTAMSRMKLIDNVAGQLSYSTTIDLSSYAGKTLYWKVVTTDRINDAYSYKYESTVASFTVRP